MTTMAVGETPYCYCFAQMTFYPCTSEGPLVAKDCFGRHIYREVGQMVQKPLFDMIQHVSHYVTHTSEVGHSLIMLTTWVQCVHMN